jgi:hypothetical protein
MSNVADAFANYAKAPKNGQVFVGNPANNIFFILIKVKIKGTFVRLFNHLPQSEDV